jgi:hypothetical protein
MPCVPQRPDTRSHGLNVVVASEAIRELEEAIELLNQFMRSTLPDAPTKKQPYT